MEWVVAMVIYASSVSNTWSRVGVEFAQTYGSLILTV